MSFSQANTIDESPLENEFVEAIKLTYNLDSSREITLDVSEFEAGDLTLPYALKVTYRASHVNLSSTYASDEIIFTLVDNCVILSQTTSFPTGYNPVIIRDPDPTIISRPIYEKHESCIN